jgi:hypothetical protein
VTVRDLTAKDIPELLKLHERSGIDYKFPDLTSPLFVVKKVITDDDGNIQAACALRLAAETYLFLDQDIHPRDKIEAMATLQPEVLNDAYLMGIDDVFAAIPELIEKRFAKRLKWLGWTPGRSGWNRWTQDTKPKE